MHQPYGGAGEDGTLSITSVSQYSASPDGPAAPGRTRQPVPAAGTGHPLRRARRRRGLTLTVLADLAGLSVPFLSMVENGQRALSRRDDVNALAAALRVPPAEIAPSLIAGFDEWAQPPVLAAGFPAAADAVTAARHERLAAEFMTYVARGDTRAAGIWLRRAARDPGVNPWLLLDLLAARDAGATGARSPQPARSRASLSHRDERAVQAGGTPQEP
jgi:transcriptional regulator with XRE-family HTH domain